MKCDYCNADMCNECVHDRKTIRVNSMDFGTTLMCADCSKRFNTITRGNKQFFDEDFKEETVANIKRYIKGRIFAEAI